MMKTQFKMILEALERGERLTALDALRRFGCFQMAARIFEIKRAGYNVKTKTVTSANGKKHFALYYLENGVEA